MDEFNGPLIWKECKDIIVSREARPSHFFIRLLGKVSCIINGDEIGILTYSSFMQQKKGVLYST